MSLLCFEVEGLKVQVGSFNSVLLQLRLLLLSIETSPLFYNLY